MLRLTRVVRCALITSSLFSSSRASSSGQRVERRAWPLASARSSRQRGGDAVGGTDPAKAGVKSSDMDGLPLDFDVVSAGVEGDFKAGGEILSPSLRDGLGSSHPHHFSHLPAAPKGRSRRKPPQLPPASSPVLSPPLQRDRRAESPSRFSTSAKRRKRAEGAVEEATWGEADDTTRGENGLLGGVEMVNGHMDSHITSPSSPDDDYHPEDDNTKKNTRNNTVLTNPFFGLHDHITRSYRLDQLLAVAQPEDVLLGRQETKSGAFSFIRFRSTPEFLADSKKSVTADASRGVVRNDSALVVAERLLAFPPHMRHFHSICGRTDVPCDFFADIDLPNETVASGEKLLLEMLNYLEVRLQGIGFLQPSFLILTNEVPGPDKVSYHVHARSMGVVSGEEEEAEETEGKKIGSAGGDDSAGGTRKKKNRTAADKSSSSLSSNKKKSKRRAIAFQDYRVVKLLADEVNMTLGRTVIDEQCYRLNGMLRCAFSSKIVSSPTGGSLSQKGKRLVPLLKAQDTMLQRRLDDMAEHLQTLTEAEILERSFGTRFAPMTENHKSGDAKDTSRSFKLVRAKHVLGPKEAQAVEFDAYGNAVSAYLTEGAKWRRFKTVVEKLRRMPPTSAESYDLWVRVGLALHNFSNEDHVFEEWVRFSLKCPQKYSRESCRKKWQQFERNPDALNWRRGFNYLNTTVWRSVRGF